MKLHYCDHLCQILNIIHFFCNPLPHSTSANVMLLCGYSSLGSLSGFSKICTLLILAYVVSILENRHIMQRHHIIYVTSYTNTYVCHQVQSCMKSHCKTFCYASKLYTCNIKVNSNFVMNIVLSPFLYLDLYGLGDNASIS